MPSSFVRIGQIGVFVFGQRDHCKFLAAIPYLLRGFLNGWGDDVRSEKKSYKGTLIRSVLAIALFVWLVVGLFLYGNFAAKTMKVQRKMNSEKVNTVASNMKIQYDTWMSIAFKISNDSDFIQGRRLKNAYYEKVLLKALSKHELSSPLVENIFAFFKDDPNIFSFKYGKSNFDIFCQHYNRQWGSEVLYTQLQELKTTQIIPCENWIIVATPCYGEQRQQGIIGFIIPLHTLQEHVELLIGEINGLLSIYFRDVPVMGVSMEWQGLKSGIYRIDGGLSRYVSEKTGNFQVVLDASDGLIQLAIQSFSGVNIVYMLLLGLLIVVLAVVVGYRNYRPVGFLVKKYWDKGISENQNELSQLESLLDETLENEEKAKQHIVKQYQMLRRQLLLLVLQGDETHCALAKEGFMDIRLDGPQYLLLCFSAAGSLTDEEFQVLETLVSNLCNEKMKCYFSNTHYSDKYCVLMSLSEESELDGVLASIQKLMENQGLQYQCASPIYEKLTKTPNMLAFTLAGAPKDATISHKSDLPRLFVQNRQIKQSLICSVRKGNEPAVRQTYAEYLADVLQADPLEPMEFCMHNELIYDLCITAQKDAIPLQAERLAMLLSTRSIVELRSELLRFILELSQAYQNIGKLQGEQEAESPEYRHVFNILLFIDENLTNSELSLDMLASHLGLSTRYISTLIKKVTGRSYKDYVTDKRMEYAMQLFIQEKMPVTQVAQRVGYNNLSNFIKTFKHFAGETPGAFCERNQKDI